jgi:enoyl-CoA hydratase/carnithine racemase
MAYLVRLVGETLAADLVLSCRPFGAEEALGAGFVSRVIPAGELPMALDELEACIVGKAANVLRATKQQLREIRHGSFDARNDADALLAALRDPESARQGMEYIARRIRKTQGASR